MNDQQARAQRLKSLRAHKKLSQYALSDLSGVPRDTIAKIETKGSINPNKESIRKLALCLGSTFEYLMHGTEPGDKFDPEIRLIALRLQRIPESKREQAIDTVNKIIDNL